MVSFKKIFRDAKKTLEERQRREIKFKREWDESRVEYVKRFRAERREALLQKCVAHRVCPVCKKVRLESALWFVITEQRVKRFKRLPEIHKLFTKHLNKVICRSCCRAFDWKLKYDNRAKEK